jgi:transposase-like protein
MAENKSQSGTGKCPKCGSYNVWVTMNKPPSYFCRACGHEYVVTRNEPEENTKY